MAESVFRYSAVSETKKVVVDIMMGEKREKDKSSPQPEKKVERIVWYNTQERSEQVSCVPTIHS